MALPVQVNGDTVVTLADVAEIRRSFKDRTSYARFNGRSGQCTLKSRSGQTQM